MRKTGWFLLLIIILSFFPNNVSGIGKLHPNTIIHTTDADVTIGGIISWTNLKIETQRIRFNSSYFGIYPSAGSVALTIISMNTRHINFTADGTDTTYNWTWATNTDPAVQEVSGALTWVEISAYPTGASEGMVILNMTGTGTVSVEVNCSDNGEPGSIAYSNQTVIEFDYDAGTMIANFTVSLSTEDIEIDWTVGDYTDADAADGDTVTVYGISSGATYSFDDETGSTVVDVSGSNNPGTIYGATRTGSGLYGRALSFDGTDDYMKTTDSATLDITPDLTLSMWIKTSDATLQGLLAKEGAYGLSVTPNYGIRMTINTTVIDTSPNVFSSDTWAHITATFDGSFVKIYVDGVLNTTQALSGVININANHVFIGNTSTYFFNGIIDEVRVLDYVPSTIEVVGLRDQPINSFPYSFRGSISDMDCTDWVFAGEAYEFVGEFVQQNASYPLDTVNLKFNDGVSWLTVTYDVVEDEFDLSSSFAYSMVNSYTVSGNVYNVTWELYITEDVFDALDVDISMYCNDTSANSDGYEIVETDYFNIYNHGGLSEYETSGDGISVAGEGVFGLAAQNSSTNSWAYANITWRKLQHVNFLVHWWSNTAYNTTLNYWECPTEHAETGYVEYGIDYWHDDVWLEGWKVRLEIVDGDAGTHGVGTDQAWVKINATWYNRGVYVKNDLFYAYYEAIGPSDTTTQFALFVDLWVGIEGGSSTVGGRVNAEYFGMNETGWGPWANWSPMDGLEDESVFIDDLLDGSSAVISAEELELFLAWASINKTSDDAGDPGCDSHQWGLIDYSGPYWRTLPPTDVMTGINTPIPTQTVTPGEVSGGFFSALITAMIEGITKPIVAALGGGASTLYFAVAAIIDSAFSAFNIDGFIAAITTMITTYGTYILSSMLSMTSLVVQMFRIITISSTKMIDWLTRMITFILTMGKHVLSIIDGTSTTITGLTNMWSLMNISAWVDVIPIFGFVWWMDAIDKRARRMGGGWMTTFIGDLQMASFIISFFVDWMTRVIEFVIGRIQWLMNAIKL